MAFDFNPRMYPEQPGCYLMKNAEGKIIYIGKAKNLRNRLRSYFRKELPTPKLQQLSADIADIEVVLVANETESLLLENNLIKLHKPKYNSALKRDNSGYAYLGFTDEPIPRLAILFRNRKAMKSDSGGGAPGSILLGGKVSASQRFGPYPNGKFRNALQEFVNEHYGLRSCQHLPRRVCLYYHLGKCSGVCEGMISKEEYLADVARASALLSNRDNELIAELEDEMTRLAERLEYEKAARLMAQIRSLQKLLVKQVADRDTVTDQDVLFFGEDHVMLTCLRSGMIRSMEFFPLDETGTDAGYVDRFLIKRYLQERPDELIVNRIQDVAAVRKTLRRGGGGKPVGITVPKRGAKFELLEICRQNYEYRARQLCEKI
ncbi:GIY-YIG nuclease family protein [Gorillibacterium massiliense]|uniref:GIY-YIG nuclease family protein n=1 Tax=Gorillibacterium massiliense TaxID=1280390 RepID=UPI0004AD84AB|nr:GIY-YIG nuclease family protein [Gorillibacterium massiliense]